MFRAGPDATQVDRVHLVELFGCFLKEGAGRASDSCVVEGHVQSAEFSYSAFDHSGCLRFV